MNVNEYLKKCLELSERALKGPWEYGGDYTGKVRYNNSEGIICQHVHNDDCAKLIAFSRTALPKVCEALKVAMGALAYYEQKEYESATMTDGMLQFTAEDAFKSINKLFDDADGG